ncbi:MAG: hypothetical protein IAF58_19710 [Leptolyngbya sp.]|nr:hypothetical protein [Candidatus Melainabacteria bacterium]
MDTDAPKTADQKPEQFAFAPPPMTMAPTYQSTTATADAEVSLAQAASSPVETQEQDRLLDRLKSTIYQLSDPAYEDYEENSPDPFDMDEIAACVPVTAKPAHKIETLEIGVLSKKIEAIQPFTQNQQNQTLFSSWWS